MKKSSFLCFIAVAVILAGCFNSAPNKEDVAALLKEKIGGQLNTHFLGDKVNDLVYVLGGQGRRSGIVFDKDDLVIEIEEVKVDEKIMNDTRYLVKAKLTGRIKYYEKGAFLEKNSLEYVPEEGAFDRRVVNLPIATEILKNETGKLKYDSILKLDGKAEVVFDEAFDKKSQEDDSKRIEEKQKRLAAQAEMEERTMAAKESQKLYAIVKSHMASFEEAKAAALTNFKDKRKKIADIHSDNAVKTATREAERLTKAAKTDPSHRPRVEQLITYYEVEHPYRTKIQKEFYDSYKGFYNSMETMKSGIEMKFIEEALRDDLKKCLADLESMLEGAANENNKFIQDNFPYADALKILKDSVSQK